MDREAKDLIYGNTLDELDGHILGEDCPCGPILVYVSEHGCHVWVHPLPDLGMPSPEVIAAAIASADESDDIAYEDEDEGLDERKN